jgi:hypothetical protein
MPAGHAGGHRPPRSGNRRLVTALPTSQTIGYGAHYYAFAVLLVPIAADLRGPLGGTR